MALTTHGFPYPAGSDKMADTDLKIKALADMLEADVKLIKMGFSTITTVGGTTVPKNIVFAADFPSGVVPVVVPIALTDSPNLIDMSIGTGATNHGFTVYMYRSSGSGVVSFAWVAFG